MKFLIQLRTVLGLKEAMIFTGRWLESKARIYGIFHVSQELCSEARIKITVSSEADVSFETLFLHELVPHPLALFDDSCDM